MNVHMAVKMTLEEPIMEVEAVCVLHECSFCLQIADKRVQLANTQRRRSQPKTDTQTHKQHANNTQKRIRGAAKAEHAAGHPEAL